MFQVEAERAAYRTAALTVLRKMISNIDEDDIADVLHDAAGRNEAWALEKHLEWRTEPEMVERVSNEVTELLDAIAPFIGATRAEVWNVQWLSESREQGRKEHPDEASARAYYDGEIARVWPLHPDTEGARNPRSHPDQDPWVLELRRIATLTAVVDRADSTTNWPQVAAGE